MYIVIKRRMYIASVFMFPWLGRKQMKRIGSGGQKPQNFGQIPNGQNLTDSEKRFLLFFGERIYSTLQGCIVSQYIRSNIESEANKSDPCNFLRYTLLVKIYEV